MRGKWWLVGAAVLAVVASGGAAVLAAAPSVPDARALAVIGRLASPDGVCVDRIERAAGWIDVCWEAVREDAEEDPIQDLYRLRVWGTFGSETGGVRWVVLRADLDGEPSNRVFQAWPDGEYTGECRQVEPGLGGTPSVPEVVCGRTVGTFDDAAWAHTVTWTCEQCLVPDGATRAISLHALVAVEAGTVPGWEIRGDIGG